jgi:hypothetical protein
LARLRARELVRLALGVRRELHQRQHLVGALLDFRLRQTLALEAEGHVLPDVEVRKQRVGLEHHVHRAVVGRHGRHVLPAEQDAPRRGFLEAREHAQQGGLATARAAQQGKDLALADGQRHLVHRHRLVKPFDQFLGHQETRCVCHLEVPFCASSQYPMKRAVRPGGRTALGVPERRRRVNYLPRLNAL